MILDQQQESATPTPTLKIDITWKEVIAEIERMTRLSTSNDADVKRFALGQIERLYSCYLFPNAPSVPYMPRPGSLWEPR